MTTLPSNDNSPSLGDRIRGGFARARRYAPLYLLAAPTVIMLAVFGYLPKVDVFRYAFYEWNPPDVVEFTGFRNFAIAFEDAMFWQSFSVVLILLAANLIKMWPSIFTAIVLHRLKSDRMRYFYQVLFVIPMVVPELVWLLIWKSFYEPNSGILNQFLRLTGIMDLLGVMNHVMPAISSVVLAIEGLSIDIVFGSVWGLALFGAGLLLFKGRASAIRGRWLLLGLFVLIGIFLWGAIEWDQGDLIVSLVGIVRATLLLGALIALRAVLSTRDELISDSVMWWSGIGVIAIASLLVVFGHIWPTPIEAFDHGRPNWLGNQDLIIPAVILWGFPWVGVVGVMIYLAGLQNISEDVYEAAELDGVGPIGKLFYIELPLIMTQVRINLIFLTIGTLTGYGLFLILLGPSGGPGGAGLVPGLYMFQLAFIHGRFGYACMLGLVMFVIILSLTIIYQKYVRVEH